jgi:hypothetical protein
LVEQIEAENVNNILNAPAYTGPPWPSWTPYSLRPQGVKAELARHARDRLSRRRRPPASESRYVYAVKWPCALLESFTPAFLLSDAYTAAG